MRAGRGRVQAFSYTIVVFDRQQPRCGPDASARGVSTQSGRRVLFLSISSAIPASIAPPCQHGMLLALPPCVTMFESPALVFLYRLVITWCLRKLAQQYKG